MAFKHGKSGVFNLADTADSPTDITAYVKDVGITRTTDVAESSVLGLTSKTYEPGLLDATISISGNFDPVVDAILVAALANKRAFFWGPQGSTSGLVKYSGTVICTSYNPDSPVDDVGNFSADFQVTGNVTRTTF